MKIYLKNKNSKISEKIKLESMEINEYDQLISNEGIFKYNFFYSKIR